MFFPIPYSSHLQSFSNYRALRSGLVRASFPLWDPLWEENNLENELTVYNPSADDNLYAGCPESHATPALLFGHSTTGGRRSREEVTTHNNRSA